MRPDSRRILTAFVAACVVLVPGHVPRAQGIDRTAVWTANRRSAVKVKVTGRDAGGNTVRSRGGAGVIVGSNGVILTASHVVGADTDWFEIPGGGGRERQVEVFALDANGIERPLGKASVTPLPPYDAAVLNLTATGLPAAAVATAPPDELSSVVAILWDPDASQPEPVTGDLVPTDRGRYGDRLTARIAVVEGNSGSGLFSGDGKLVGIVTNQLGPTRALAIPAYVVTRYLAPSPQARDVREEAVSCEAVRARLVDRQPFLVEGGVRCESMGDVKEGVVEYAPPPDYAVVGQVTKADQTNYGTVGTVRYRTEAGRVAGVDATIRCATPMRPFGPGGWAHASLAGFIEKVVAPADAERIALACPGR